MSQSYLFFFIVFFASQVCAWTASFSFLNVPMFLLHQCIHTSIYLKMCKCRFFPFSACNAVVYSQARKTGIAWPVQRFVYKCPSFPLSFFPLTFYSFLYSEIFFASYLFFFFFFSSSLFTFCFLLFDNVMEEISGNRSFRDYLCNPVVYHPSCYPLAAVTPYSIDLFII